MLRYRLALLAVSMLPLAGFGCAAEGDLPEAENQQPVANAGADQEVQVGGSVMLSGSGSLDPDGDELTYRWTLSRPVGSSAQLSSTNFVETGFDPDLPGKYTVKLVVNDGQMDSVPAQVEITAVLRSTANNSENRTPTADAGADQNVQVGMMVQLDGTSSTDPDGDPLFFDWLIEGKPAGSGASLSSQSAPKPTFTPDLPGVYEISLVVDDGVAQSSADTILIEAFTGNTPPVANAGVDQTVATGSRVQLDGSSSVDVDGDALTYTWTLASRPNGSAAELSSTDGPRPSFSADVDGEYRLQLVVNDGNADSEMDEVVVTSTTANVPPTADAGTDQQVQVGATVQLDGSGSVDSNDDALTYQWSLKSVPTGSTASIDDATIASPSFVADVEGVYIAELRVDDGQVVSVPDSVTITATVNNVAPVANAGADQAVITGTEVSLDGTFSSDADNDSLTYAWTLTGKPTGSNAALSSTTADAPKITPDVDGTYVVQLVVNDGRVDSAPDSVVITAATPASPSPAAHGDLILTEMMLDPTVVSDTQGEWIEIYNPSTTLTYDLQNCIIEDVDIDSHVINGSLEIGPGEYLVLAVNTNVGFVPDYVYSGFRLGNSEDEIIISCNGVGIVDVAWGPTLGPDFVVPTGASLSLLDDYYDEELNDDAAFWCESSNVYRVDSTTSAEDKGTPGIANGFTTTCQ